MDFWRRRASFWAVVLVLLFGGVPAFAQDGGDGGGGEEEELPPITKMPELLAFVKAEYPAKAVEDKVEASVLLEIDVDDLGYVEGVRVIGPAEPAGYGFDEAAVAAVSQFEFSPAETAEGPIPVTFTYRYNFVLEVEPDPEPDPDIQPDPDNPDKPVEPEREPVVNFQGTVLERGTRRPLVGVVVLIFRGEGEEAVGYEALTDEEGLFEFFDVPEGEWKILIQPDGYFPFRTVESVTTGELLEITCYVEKGTYNEFDVLVEGNRVRKEVARRVLEAKVIDKIPGTFGDPIKVVQNLPGVARVGFGSGEIVVRGSSPEDTRVYIGGVLVPLLFHFGGLRSVVPIGMIEKIEFIPGNFSTEYGRATGGLLNVDLKNLAPENINGYVDINLFDSGAYIEAPLGDTASIAVAARRSYIDAVLTAVIPEDAPVNLIAAPRYYDGQLLFNWRPVNDHRVSFFLFASDDELRLLFENPAQLGTQIQSGDAGISTGFVRGILTHEWTPTNNFTNTFLLSSGYDDVNFNLGDQFFLEIFTYRAQLRDTMRAEVTDDITVVAGLDAEWEKTDLRIRLPNQGPPKEGEVNVGPPDFTDVVFIEQNDQRERSVAVFANLELQGFDDKLLVVPGVRMDYFEQVDAFTFEPRVTARYDLNKQWALKGGAGLFMQPPTDDETVAGFGNPNLGPEKAFQYSLGTEYRPLEYLSFDVTLFYKDMEDLVGQPEQTAEDTEVDRYANDAEGRVYGMELLVKHELANNFFGWITYTLSRAERLDPGETKYRLFDFDQTHILTLIGSYQLPLNWEISARWRYVTGNPDTPIVGGVFNSDADRYEALVGAVNSARLSSFHQLDIRVDKRWIYETWQLNLYLDIQNAYNRSNVEGQDFNFDFSQSQPQQGLPLLPVLGIKGSF